jgi:hypothetical protein
MNRRSFFSSLAAFAATATLDPERLLWRPGAKTIFVPSLLTNPEIGISIKLLRSYDIGMMRASNRYDVIYLPVLNKSLLDALYDEAEKDRSMISGTMWYPRKTIS